MPMYSKNKMHINFLTQSIIRFENSFQIYTCLNVFHPNAVLASFLFSSRRRCPLEQGLVLRPVRAGARGHPRALVEVEEQVVRPEASDSKESRPPPWGQWLTHPCRSASSDTCAALRRVPKGSACPMGAVALGARLGKPTSEKKSL